MFKYVIRGGKPLYGEIPIGGAKNAAVAIIPAALMIDGACRIDNIPQISDVTMLLNILQEMGADIRTLNRHAMHIDCAGVTKVEATFEMMRRIRASYYLIGALLGRYGRAVVAMPGGCNFGGVRPIDQHIKGFKAMGAQIEVKNGLVYAEAEGGRLKGANIYLDVVSVGATINIMLAAALAEGKTVIENAAKEPHIVDLANFLNSMGADIRGAGTNVIKIFGVDRLRGGAYSIIPDQIDAGTYMAAVAGTGGEVKITNVIPKHLDCISGKLREMGISVEDGEDFVIIKREGSLTKTNLKTLPYPGFPTDMQPQMSTILCLAEGTSVVTEGVWDNRYKYVDELARMGGNIKVEGNVAVIDGVKGFTGAQVESPDLRAGAALVMAGLAAEGFTIVDEIGYILRGYEDFDVKLQSLGAMIEVVDTDKDVQKFKLKVG